MYIDRRTQLSIIIFLAGLSAIMWLKSPAFFSIQNLNDIAINTSYLAISSLGMMFVIVINSEFILMPIWIQ